MALRYLGAKKAEGFVSVIAIFAFLGILLGVATLIIVMSVMNGFREELMTRILGLNGHINLYAQTGFINEYDTLAAEAMQVTGVESAIPGIEKQALMTIGQNATGVLVRGLRDRDFSAKPILSESLISGTLIDFQGNGAFIGSAMSDRLDLRLGENFVLVSPSGRTTPFGTMPRSRQFYVAGVFDVEMHEYNNNFVYLPLETTQQFFDMGQAVNMIEIFTHDTLQVDRYRDALSAAMPPDIRVVDWQQSNGSFFNALKVERNVMFLILTLIILVAAFNIISSMIMLVKDKGRDVAILRTMGASSTSILRIFIMAGSCIGVIGTAVGATIGITFALNIENIRGVIEGLTGAEFFPPEVYFLTQLPSQLQWGDVFAVVGLALGLSFAATIYPAWRAARIDPVEALRYE